MGAIPRVARHLVRALLSTTNGLVFGAFVVAVVVTILSLSFALGGLLTLIVTTVAGS